MLPRTLSALLALTTIGYGAVMTDPAHVQDRMFSEAQAYERFMGRWSRRLAPRLVQFAGVADGQAMLDVGSGTGALAAAMADAAPTSRIVGIDPSATYVALAQSRMGGDRLHFQVGDAQRMEFPDHAFDRTMSLLVVNFIPDADKAVDEMVRVTRTGGVVAAAVWDYGAGMEMLRVFWDEAVAVTPAAEPKDERHMRFCRQGELAALWSRHGLVDVTEDGLTIETRFRSFDDFWEPFLAGQGPAGAHVAGLPAADRAALERRLRTRLLGGGGDRDIVMRARAWAVRGTRQ